MLLATVTAILLLCLPVNSTFCAPFGMYINRTAVMLDGSRGCEACTDWVWGPLSGQWGEQVEGEA